MSSPSTTDIKFLKLLLDEGRMRRASYIGSMIWGKRDTYEHRAPQSFARPAGKVLHRLERQKLARYITCLDDWGWVITAKGKDVISQIRNEQ